MVDGALALLIAIRQIIDHDTPVVCTIFIVAVIVTYWMSISIFCFMSVHLLIVIRRLKLPNAAMLTKTAHKVLSGIWIVSILVWSGLLIPLVKISYQSHTYQNSCLLQPNKDTILSNLTVTSIFYSLWLTIIMINLTSVKLLRAKMKHPIVQVLPALSIPNMVMSSTFMSSKVRKFKDYLVIVSVTSVVFTVCILPAVAITTGTLMSSDAEEGRSTGHRPVTFILMFINSCSNILIYYWRIKDFREFVNALFTRYKIQETR